MKRFFVFLTVLVLLLASLPCALAAKSKATPTPEPVAITSEVLDPPEAIQQMLDIAWKEWEDTAGKRLKKSNKYTKWWNNYEWEWCAGFVTWCMLEAGIPQEFKDDVFKMPEDSVTGLFHIKASSPGKMLAGYLHLHRTTRIPQRGFVVDYGEASNGYIHVGIVWDVQLLENGKYRLTTIEGNMKNTVRMYVFDYDPLAEKTKCVTAVPEEERTMEESSQFTYKLHQRNKKIWYVNYFLMPWIPGDETL